MHSLYGLQVALINARGYNAELRRDFTKHRQRLRNSWELILTFLKDSHAFGSDAITLSKSIGSEPTDSVREFLKTLSLSSNKLHERASGLVNMNQSAVCELGNQNLSWSEALKEERLRAQVPISWWMPGIFNNRSIQGDTLTTIILVIRLTYFHVKIVLWVRYGLEPALRREHQSPVWSKWPMQLSTLMA